jgi:hypothetical protein
MAVTTFRRRLPHGPADLRRTAGIENATRGLLLGGVMPLWLSAGLADWYLHRRTRIEDTAGPRESALHSLMFAETGVPVLLGLFCEVNAGVLASAAGAVAAHSATAYWDQAYAEPRRRVTPIEQNVHSLLEVSPVMATFLLTVLAVSARWPRRSARRTSALPHNHCQRRSPHAPNRSGEGYSACSGKLASPPGAAAHRSSTVPLAGMPAAVMRALVGNAPAQDDIAVLMLNRYLGDAPTAEMPRARFL